MSSEVVRLKKAGYSLSMRIPRFTLIAATVTITLALAVAPAFTGYPPTSTAIFLNRVLAPVAFVLFSLNFLLATRWAWVMRLAGGLDKVYQQHHMTGGTALILMLLHPLLMMMDALPNYRAAAAYVALNFPPDTSFERLTGTGQVALAGLTILLVLTYYAKLPYHIWKRTHVLMGLLYAPLVSHLLANPNLQERNPALFWWLCGWAGIGIASYCYRRFLYRFLAPHRSYVVEKVERDAASQVTQVTLRPAVAGPSPAIAPGQFAFFTFNLPGLREKHPFSFTSLTHGDGRVGFAFKTLGDYTGKLARDVKTGVSLTVYGPYGQFGERFVGSRMPAVLVAGGVGITPFLSFLEYELSHPNPERPILLVYAVKTLQEACFWPEIQAATHKLPHLQAHLHVTENNGLLTFAQIQTRAGSPFAKAAYFLCGPPGMMQALSHQGKEAGIPARKFIFENFSLT